MTDLLHLSKLYCNCKADWRYALLQMTVFGLCEALTTNSTGKLLLLLFSHKLTFQTSLIIFEYTH